MNFGISNSIKSRVVRICTPELFERAINLPTVKNVCAEIADAREQMLRGELTRDEFETLKGELKKKLPILTPHATFKNGRRLNAEAIPSGLSMFDLDHIPNPEERWKGIEPRAEELGIVLAHITPSSEGLRLFFIVPTNMDLGKAQAWMAHELGEEKYDICVKDYARSSFVVPKEYILYQSQLLFSAEEILKKRKAAAEMPITPHEKEVGYVKTEADPPTSEGKTPEAFKEIPYPLIVECLAEQLGGVPEHGARNNFIFSMACHLRYVCNDDAEWIARILPTYGEEREKAATTIRSAVNRPQNRQMPTLMKRVLDIAQKRMAETTPEKENGASLPPPMPQHLPPLIELLTRNVPEGMKAAVAHAVFPPLGAHLGGVKFRYIDNVEREATFMCVLLAKMSSGKSSVNTPIKLIMKDIVERDALNRKREQEWKNSLSSKGANKEKPKRPEGLCIQMLVPDMTNAAFVQRLQDANGEFLYTSLDELELMNNLKTGGRGNQVSQIIRLAFDCGLYGQERVGSASVTAMVPIRWNWNASATIERGRNFFRSSLTDGTLSRLNFCTIDPIRMGEIPVYGTYDAAYEEELRPYINRLNEAKGLVECKKAEALAHTLLKENAEVVMLTDDEAYEMLSHRANVIAYLKAMTLYIAHGYKWDKRIEEFVRWSLKYDMWCKIRFFGEQMDEALSRETIKLLPGKRNMLQMLPNRFSKHQLEDLRNRLGKEPKADMQIRKWRQRGYILQDETEEEFFFKSDMYLNKFER